MIVFSAVQALSPAVERTRRILFTPFRWWTFLKLCAVAVLTEGLGGNYNFSGPSAPHHPSHAPSLTATSFAGPALPIVSFPSVFSPGWIAMIAAIIAASLAIAFAIFYVITRLRFALFYCLTYQVTEIRPGWRLYREPANRFFKLNLFIGLGFLFLMVLTIAPLAFGFYRIFHQTHGGGHFDVLLFVSLFLPALALLALILLVGFAVDIILRDFMLPHFALEDATAGTAWAQVRARMGAEKGSFFLYAVLRILLPVAATMVVAIALIIPTLIVFGILAALTYGAHIVLPDSRYLYVVLAVVVGSLAAAYGLLMAICFGGPLSIWVRNFALVFYGGRYPLLGNVLFPSFPSFQEPGGNPAT